VFKSLTLNTRDFFATSANFVSAGVAASPGPLNAFRIFNATAVPASSILVSNVGGLIGSNYGSVS
jgi:hypothetical protein